MPHIFLKKILDLGFIYIKNNAIHSDLLRNIIAISNHSLISVWHRKNSSEFHYILLISNVSILMEILAKLTAITPFTELKFNIIYPKNFDWLGINA